MRLLEVGDQFQAVYNVCSIRGVESYRARLFVSPHAPLERTLMRSTHTAALLLIGVKNLYLVDAYFYTAAGEVIDSWEAPDEVRSGPFDRLCVPC